MNAKIEQFLTSGRAVAVTEKGEQVRVSVPVNRSDLTVGIAVVLKDSKDVSKKMGVSEKSGDKSVIVVKDVKFKEAEIDLDKTDAAIKAAQAAKK
jgi:hypothetical protein